MIGVIAKLSVKPDMVDTFETEAAALVKSVNTHEPGCIMYELFKSPTDPSSYVFMEKYEDKAALEAHGKTDYFLAAQGALGPCLSAPPDIKTYVPVG